MWKRIQICRNAWIKLGARHYVRNKAQVTEATPHLRIEKHRMPVLFFTSEIYISIPSNHLVIYHRKLNEQLRFLCVRARARKQSLKAWRQSTNGLSRTALKPFQIPDTGVAKYVVAILLFITFGAVWGWFPWYWGPNWHLSVQKLWFRRVQRSLRRQSRFSAVLSIIFPTRSKSRLNLGWLCGKPENNRWAAAITKLLHNSEHKVTWIFSHTCSAAKILEIKLQFQIFGL